MCRIPLLLLATIIGVGVGGALAQQQQQDFIVIGAGISGLKAAYDLCSKGYSVTVLESRSRTGGRVHTTTIGQGLDAVKTEVGAGWLHGSDTNSVKKWCDANGIANIITDDNSGEGWTKNPTATKAVEFLNSDWTALENGSTNFGTWAANNAASWPDTVNLFDKFKTWIATTTYTSIRQKNMVYRGVVENLADLERGATLKELGRNFDEGKNLVGTENIIKEGYSKVTDKLVTMITAFPNCIIKLNEKATKISTVVDGRAGYVSNVTISGGINYLAPRIVMTVPLGVLKANTIVFDPVLPTDKTNAIAKLGVGLLNKITLLYSKDFWTNDVNQLGKAMWFTVLDPTALNLTIGAEPPKPQREFWNAAKYFNKPVVTMLYGATTADDYEKLTDAEVVTMADTLFRSLWTGTSDAVIKGYNISRWRADDHAKGSYSYLPP